MPRRRREPERLTFRSHPHLYEINTWAWLDELSRKYGRTLTLDSVPDEEWDALRDLGFDFIWLMGMWKRSPLGRQIFQTWPEKYSEYDQALPGWRFSQVVGSPYCIQEYEPDPHLGTWQALDQVRSKLHARGMGLVLDFVANHTALDHPWVTEHPDYYIQGREGDFRRDPSGFYLAEPSDGQLAFIARGKDPYFPPWRDVAQLNYFNPAMRQAILGELRKIAQYCDAVRCDMAMLILNDVFAHTWGRFLQQISAPDREFWPDAIAAVPGFVWIAEVYWDLEYRLQQFGFQFTYDKRLYDRLRVASPREVYLHLTAEAAYQKASMRFLENHDEQRSAAVFGRERLPALVTLVATLPGMRMYHQGQLDGRRIHLPVALSAAADEPPEPSIRSFYERVLHLSNEDVFHTGEWTLLEPQPAGSSNTAENLIAYQWCSSEAWSLVVVNLSGTPAEGCLKLPKEISGSKQYLFRDRLTETNYPRNGVDLARDGLYVRLERYQAHLFEVREE